MLDPKYIPLFLTLGFGLIGFLDDYLKVVMKRSAAFNLQTVLRKCLAKNQFAAVVAVVDSLSLVCQSTSVLLKTTPYFSIISSR